MSGEKDSKKTYENAMPSQDKADVKKEDLKAKQFEQKDISEKKVVKPEGYKEHGVNRKPCKEKGAPRERDVERKRLKRHLCQKPAVKSEQHCQERRMCQVSGSTAVKRKGCQDSRISRANRIKRKWHHQTRCREKETSFLEAVPFFK